MKKPEKKLAEDYESNKLWMDLDSKDQI